MKKAKRSIFVRMLYWAVYLVVGVIAIIAFIMYSNSADAKSFSALDLGVIFCVIVIIFMSSSIENLKEQIEDLESRVLELESDDDDYTPHGYLYGREHDADDE